MANKDYGPGDPKNVTGSPRETTLILQPESPKVGGGNLWQLSYIRNNAIKTTLLAFDEGLNIAEVVGKAKEYCKQRSWNFSWMEPAIVDLREKENK